MYFDNNSASNLVRDAISSWCKKKENIILVQLSELLEQGLLVIEETVPCLVREDDSDKITIRQAVRLVLKDQDIINNLKKENQELKTKLELINKAIMGEK